MVSYLEGAVQPLGLQIPDVNALVQTSAHQELRGGAQTHTGLFLLSNDRETTEVIMILFDCYNRVNTLLSPRRPVPPLGPGRP